MVERIKRPADPEVLLNIDQRRAEPVGGGEKQISAICNACSNDLLETFRAHP